MSNYIKIILSITIISAICGGILSWTYNKTKDKIAYAEKLDFINSLKVVLPEHNNYPDEEVIKIGDKTVYKAMLNGNIVGYAVSASSNKGYSGIIEVLIGVDINGKISGVSVIKHKETPGLGDKITESSFLNLFKLISDYSKIAVKKDGGIIDEFSGATMSPRAVSEATSIGLKFIQENIIFEDKNEVK